MDKNVLFSEKQKFSQWWAWLIIIALNGVFIYGIYQQILNGEQFGNKPMSNTGLIITEVMMLLISFLLISSQLETQIKTDGIYVRFFPFHLKFKYYPWTNLKKSFVRKYSPLGEYGGWGLRYGIFGSGKAYNVSGNKGLQLEFLNKKKLLIGTNKPEELNALLSKLGRNIR